MIVNNQSTEISQPQEIEPKLITTNIRFMNGLALLLRLHDSDGDAVHEQQVVAPAAGERDFTEGDPLPCGEIQGFVVLDHPTRRDEHRVDLLAG